MYLITVTWGLNIGFSLVNTGMKLYKKFKDWRENKRSSVTSTIVQKNYVVQDNHTQVVSIT